MKKISIYIPDIKECLKRKDFNELTQLVNYLEPVDVVDGWGEFDTDERLAIFGLLNFDKKVQVFERLPFKQQKEIIDSITSQRLGHLLDEMASDERVDLFEHLPEEEVSKLFSLMKAQEVEDVKELLEYEEHTAGGKMTTEFVSLKPEMTAREALLALQESVNRKIVRNVYAVYTVDEQERVTGGVSLQRLIASNPEDKIADIARPVDDITIHVDLDQEEVARLFTHYDLLSAPVVDDEGKLKGVITIDDIVDVIHQEATEDIAKMAGTESEELLSNSVFKIFKIRWPWLFASWLGGLVTMTVISSFESTLLEVVAVAAFIPIIMGMGGNVGVQSSTIVVRGLALGKINLKQVWKTIFNQFKVGFLLGISYGILLGVIARMKFAASGDMLGMVVGTGICLSMTIAATMGALLPILFKKLGVDPAVATGPFVSTATDIISLSVYFVLATSILL